MKKNLALCVLACALASLTACNESVSLTGTECTHGDLRCDADDVEICDNGYWEVYTYCNGSSVCNATTFVCEVAKDTCTNGDKHCVANNVEICANDAWTIETNCEATQVCNATTFVCDETVISCDDGAKRCQTNNIEICNSNRWSIETSCASDESCNATTFVCEATCTEGTTTCTSDGKLSSCVDNKWTISDCDANQVCVNGKTACETKVCDEGSSICNGQNNATIVCTDNATVETACTGETSLCEAGNCVVCLNGDKRCENNAVEACVANVWTTQEACADKVCDVDSLSCLVTECETNWQRCNGDVVEICNAKRQYEAMKPAACAAGRLCLEDADAHTATCVQCKENKDCTTDGAAFCHSDNTCVACETGKQKCHATDGGLLVCDANGAWPSTSAACSKGHECLAGATSCTPKERYCTSVDNCTDALYPICSDETSLCSCPEGQAKCKIEAGQAVLTTCNSGTWSTYSNCNSKTPLCNLEQTACIECTLDAHCGDFYRCDLDSNICIAKFPASTIKTCTNEFHNFNSQDINGSTRIYNGEDLSTITASVLCGKPEQTINRYAILPTRKHYSWATSFLYRANTEALIDGEYTCVTAIQYAGEMPLVCPASGPAIADLKVLAPALASTTHTVMDTWDHVIDFEDCTTSETGSDGSCTSFLKYTNGMTPLDGEEITGHSLKLGPGGQVTVTVPNGAQSFVFDMKVFASSTSVNLFANGHQVISMGFPGAELLNHLEQNINISGSFDIVITTNKNIVIDNFNWTNYP